MRIILAYAEIHYIIIYMYIYVCVCACVRTEHEDPSKDPNFNPGKEVLYYISLLFEIFVLLDNRRPSYSPPHCVRAVLNN